MASIQTRRLTKKFGDLEVVRAVDLDVEDGELLVLLGPSGCGKTTLLRMLAGLEEQSSGSVSLDGVPVDALSPRERDIAFVFQSYALYPSMTVRENLSFPLVMAHFRWWHHLPVLSRMMRRRYARKEGIRTRVERVADELGLSHLLDRRPRALSGGQRQRVALGRAMVRRPKVFLMDEPLSNLDAVLRMSARALIGRLHRDLKATIIYVTHDQTEAMTLGTRVLVLKDGVCQQLGRPRDLYDDPENMFVAQFIGSPPMNMVPGEIRGEALVVGERRYPLVLVGSDSPVEPPYSGPVLVGIRPEHVRLVPSGGTDGSEVEILTVEETGLDSLVSVDTPWRSAGSAADSPFFARLPGVRRYVPGDRIRLDIGSEAMRLFDSSGNKLPYRLAGQRLGVN